MLRRRGVGVALLVVGMIALGLGGTPTASAKGKTPPSIDDLVGVYAEKEKGIDYDLATGLSDKWSESGICTITKLDATTVNMHFQTGGGTWDDVGYYGGGGIIVTGNSDDDTLGSVAYVQMVQISGSPGKMKAKGTWMNYDLGDGWCEMGSFTLKQTN